MKVNERRQSIEPKTLEKQTKIIRAQASNENQLPPTDLEKRNQEISQWKKS